MAANSYLHGTYIPLMPVRPDRQRCADQRQPCPVCPALPACGAFRGYGRPHLSDRHPDPERPGRSTRAGHGRSPALRLHHAREARRLGDPRKPLKQSAIDDTCLGINHPGTSAYQGCQTGLSTRASAVERLLDELTETSARHSITQIQGWARRWNGGPQTLREART